MSNEPSEQDVLAAEYVLGTLAPEQRRAVEALAGRDEDVARSIAEWQERLAPLALAVTPKAPPPSLWRRLALAADIEPEAALRPRAWQRAGFWRATTGAALAIAASVAFLMVRTAPPGGVPLVAALSPAGAPGAIYLVQVAPDGQAVIAAAAAPNTPADKSLELWALRPGATAPVGLGLLPQTGQRRFTLAERAGTQLLVSQEPLGGSPTGQPTGPVVFSGTLTGT